MRPLLLAVALAMVLVVAWGCSKKSKEPPSLPTTPPETKQGQSSVEHPPGEVPATLGPELSKMAGVSIRLVESPGSVKPSHGRDENGLTAERTTLFDALILLCSKEQVRVVPPAALPPGEYNLAIKADSVEAAISRLGEALEKSFGLRLVHEKRMADVYVLVSVAPKPDVLKSLGDVSGSMTFNDNRQGAILFETVNMPFVAKVLNRRTGELVVDETGLAGRYSFTLEVPWLFTLDEAVTAVKKLGLDLVKARRQVDAWFIEKAPEPDNPPEPAPTPSPEKAPATP